jgi:hypothetical protein
MMLAGARAALSVEAVPCDFKNTMHSKGITKEAN